MRFPWAPIVLALGITGCSFGCNGTVGCANGKPASSPMRGVDVPSLERVTVALVRPVPKQDLPDVFCAGVWVSRTAVLTAMHCAANAALTPEQQLMYSLLPGMEMPKPAIGTEITMVRRESWHAKPDYLHGKLERLDEKNDMALVRVKGAGIHPWADVATSDPQPGAPIFVEGHTLGQPWAYTQGYVSAERLDIEGPDSRVADEMQAVVPGFYFGNSGGGAFNSDGELVGIAQYINDAPSIGFFAPAHAIRAFVNP